MLVTTCLRTCNNKETRSSRLPKLAVKGLEEVMVKDITVRWSHHCVAEARRMFDVFGCWGFVFPLWNDSKIH
jgi:hypothetical protein